MKNIILMTVLILSQLHGYSDADWDGVEDAYDRCPQTPLSDLVDSNGCTTVKTGSAFHYTLISGIGFSQMNYASQEAADTTTLSIEADLYYDNWQLQGTIGRYSSDMGNSKTSGMEDSVLSLLYRVAVHERFSLIPQISVLFPTYETGYNNEAIDYGATLNIEYQLSSNMYGFGGIGYTWVNDTDTIYDQYQNTQSFYAGLGYTYGDGGWNIHYNAFDTIYQGNEMAQLVGVRIMRELTSHWFVDGSYDYGFTDSASKHSWNIRLGYTF